MDAATLMQVMPRPSWAQWTVQAATDYAALANEAMLLGGITSVERSAMFLAQVGEESGSLMHLEEIGRGIGQIYAPYCGRTFIQITWQSNYAAFGQWCHQQGLLADPHTFVNNPVALADDRWAWLGPVWYWTVARPQLNGLSDQRDLVAATRAINGGLNGFDDRHSRYTACMALGEAILPDHQGEDWFSMANKADLQAVVDDRLAFWLPRLIGAMRTGKPNKAFTETNSGKMLDGKGVDGLAHHDVVIMLHGDRAHPNNLDALAARLDAIERKLGI